MNRRRVRPSLSLEAAIRAGEHSSGLRQSPDVENEAPVLGRRSGAGAALYLGCNERRPAADGPNIVLIVVDSLRADHALGPRASTPNIDALAAQGMAFNRVFPEGMPTVPARNAILSGRRTFPFRDWSDHPGLLAKPGCEPLEDRDAAFTTVLWRAGCGYSDSHFLRSERWAYMADNRLRAPRLFDLSSDPGETSNLAAERPDVVAELHQTVRERAAADLPHYG